MKPKIYIVKFAGNIQAFFTTKEKAIKYAEKTFMGEPMWENIDEGTEGCEVSIEMWIEGQDAPVNQFDIQLSWKTNSISNHLGKLRILPTILNFTER